MNFLQTYRRHLIFKLAGIAALILAVLSSAYLFMSVDYARSVRKNTLALNERLTAQTATRIEAYWDSLYNITTAFCYSPTVQQYFSVNSLNRLPDTQELTSVFSNTLLLNDRILSVYLYNADAKQIASMGKNFSIDTSVLNTDAVMDIRASHLKSNEKRPYYELIFPVYDLNSIQYQKLLGTCVFVLEPESFDDTLQNAQSTEDAVVFLLDSSDCILASAGSVQSCGSTLASEILHSTSEKYFFTQTLSYNDWKIAGFLPESDLRKPDQNLKETQILVYCISLCLLLFLLLYCNYSIIKPVTGISAFIRKINQNPDSRLSLDRPDEIGTVAKSLNQMLDEKQKMPLEIEQVKYLAYETELSKKQAEILAYRSQINPHFLYNTFECIRDMALFYDVDDIAELTMALSNVFRFAVKGTDMVTVENELDHIREYAKIINYRFMGKIRIEIDAENAILNCKVFKLLLQPLVENAVFHGLEQKIENGTVWVHVFSPDHATLCFVVEDDGCGIEPERLKQILASLEIEKNTTKIGVFNIYKKQFEKRNLHYDFDSKRIDSRTRREYFMISVYIADDEVWITIGLKKLIQKSGLPFEVIGEAHNGVTTLEDIKTLKPDVLFTDIRMPGLSGLEVMSYISEHQFATKVVLISGYAEFEYARQAMLCGAFDYLLKPIQQETLNKTLSRLRNELEPAASETSEDTMENATITDLSTAGTSLFKKILAYIQEHDTEELSLTSLAEMYNISSSRLSTLIKKELGLSFSEYITARRMQKAKELLKDDSRSIEEIANAVGYHDYFYFTKVFKKTQGISPSKYRKSL